MSYATLLQWLDTQNKFIARKQLELESRSEHSKLSSFYNGQSAFIAELQEWIKHNPE